MVVVKVHYFVFSVVCGQFTKDSLQNLPQATCSTYHKGGLCDYTIYIDLYNKILLALLLVLDCLIYLFLFSFLSFKLWHIDPLEHVNILFTRE